MTTLSTPETPALPSPDELASAHPLPPGTASAVREHRDTITRVLDGSDPRLLVVAGPCSVHDPQAALEYAELLAGAARRFADELVVILRSYLEKPRTVAGWTGLLADPALDGHGDLRSGLSTGRSFLAEAAGLGMPLAYEFVDPLLAPYVADTVSWGAVGARTVASQPHRHLASWLDMPVGMKNCVSGSLTTAIDAVRAAGSAHVFAGLDPRGMPRTLRSAGNPAAHLVLRGGPEPNYSSADIAGALRKLDASGVPRRVVVDASHGNSGKDHNRQPDVLADLADQLRAGQHALVGVMLESYLAEGRQDPASRTLRRDLSVTDACLGWHRTHRLLEQLAQAARDWARRAPASPVSDR